MCDYSLHSVASRPAKVGDQLVTTRFGNSITRGFAAVGDPNVAVCLLPGTEIAFQDDIKIENWLRFITNWMGEKRPGERVARFRKIRPDEPSVHHDALELPSGTIVLLTRLCEGQYAKVLQLPAEVTAPIETENRRQFGNVA
jgi:hypothetical protein